MSSATLGTPMPQLRWHMTPLHGARGLLVGVAVAAGGAAGHNDGIFVALIAAGSTLAAVIIGPFITEAVRQHFRRSEVDHRDEMISEQAALIEHLIGELERKPRRAR